MCESFENVFEIDGTEILELIQITIRGRSLHKLSWQNFVFLDHLPPSVEIFYSMKVDKKWNFLDHLPT